MNYYILTISKIYISLCLLLLINCINCNSQTLIKDRSNSIEKDRDVDSKLLDSINSTTNSKTLSDLSLLNQLKYEKHDSASYIVITKIDTTKDEGRLILNILKNSTEIFIDNFKILNREEISDTLAVINKIKARHKLCDGCIKIAKDYSNNSDIRKTLFSKPLNVKNISDYYNIDYNSLSKLIEETKEGKKSNKVTVVKGYSPFSNEYQKFIVFADSVKETETKKLKPEVANNDFKTFAQNNNVSNSKNNKEDQLYPLDFIKNFDRESLKKYWNMYQNQDREIDMMVSKSNIISDSIETPRNISITLSNISHPKTKEVLSNESSESVIMIDDNKNQQPLLSSGTIKKSDVIEKTKASNNIPSRSIEADSEIDNNTYYYVQIAASRTPISEPLLNTIYKGHDSITIKQEEGWYKYQYGKTTNYEHAQNLVKKSNVAGAFVTAYKNNQKQVLWQAINSKNISSTVSKLVFVIQVSANSKPINIEQRAQLQNKAGGFVREIQEDGWYKYQYIVGSSYKDALLKWKKIGTKTSFLVAYFDGEKIPMSNAIKKYNENKNK